MGRVDMPLYIELQFDWFINFPYYLWLEPDIIMTGFHDQLDTTNNQTYNQQLQQQMITKIMVAINKN